jgi:hypothetical protein
MKRLLPYDARTFELRQRSTIDGTGGSHQSLRHDSTDVRPSGLKQQCALPVEPDPRRTALYAIVSGSTDDGLLVREAPIEILPFRDTDLVHLVYTPGGGNGDEIELRVSDRTCFDVQQPFALPDPGTPVIVVGINLGGSIDAEIIASMESEARYRSLVQRYQQTRDWRRGISRVPDSGANERSSSS